MVGVIAANNTNDMCPECEKKLIRAYIDWMDWTQNNQPGLWAGYNSIVHSEGEGQKFVSISFSLLFKGPQSDTVRALGVFDDLIDRLSAEVHLRQNVLEDGVYDIAQHKSIVDVALDTFELV